ncbi:MAG: hypothetical protein VXW32_11965 [Myxococcota bacterium]|nr:hypothetical protein [Myxococcota bacterium]
MRIAIVITTEGRTQSTDHLVQSLRENTQLPHDIHVVDHSVTPDGLTPRTNMWLPDRQARGSIWVQTAAFNAIRTAANYDYVWFLTDESAVRTDTDPVGILVSVLEDNPRMAVLCPTDPIGEYPGSAPRPQSSWHAATDCPHVGFMVRTAAVDEVGFMNPRLRYSLGAMTEYAYKLYSEGWFVAYADGVRLHQPVALRGTPGQDPATVERVSQRFAFDYLFSNYGWDWPKHFSEATAAHDIAENGFEAAYQVWMSAFETEELQIRKAAVTNEAPMLRNGQQVTPVAPTPDEEPETRVEFTIQSPATTKLLVWPKYDSAADLEALISDYGRLLMNREDICLCVRHDPERDIEINAACAALTLAHERILGPEVDLHILLVNDAIPVQHWNALGEAVDASLRLPSADSDPEREAFHQALGARVIRDVVELRQEVAPPARIPSLEDLFPGMEQLAG